MGLNPEAPGDFRSRAYSFAKDAVERVLWTAVEAGAAIGIVEVADIPPWISVPIATGLAAVKALAAKHLASKGTASTATGV
jgi:hypothetical protein